MIPITSIVAIIFVKSNNSSPLKKRKREKRSGDYSHQVDGKKPSKETVDHLNGRKGNTVYLSKFQQAAIVGTFEKA